MPRASDPDAPPLRAGALVAEGDLYALAKEAVTRSGRTLASIAEELGRPLTTISDAINRPSKNMTPVRLEIVRRLAGYDAEGPFYRLRRGGE
jgi:hypothetical protein